MPKFTVQPCQADQGATYVICHESGDIVLRTWSNSPEEIEIAERAADALSASPIGDDERTAFEAWAATQWQNSNPPHAAWTGWQGRAMFGASDQATKVDAERWRALMASERMHLIGFAGIEFDGPKTEEGFTKVHESTVSIKPGPNLLFGMEFHAWHPAKAEGKHPDTAGRNVIVAYVDHLRSLDVRAGR